MEYLAEYVGVLKQWVAGNYLLLSEQDSDDSFQPNNVILQPMSKLADSAISLQTLLREQASSTENGRRIEPAVLSALHEMGAFNLQLSEEYGGQAADPLTYLRVLEELARGDGSSGWCAMVGSESSGCVNAFLKPEIVRKILVESAQSTVALTVVGAGKAVRTQDGFRVSGRWRFASGCRHSTWLGALCVIYDGEVAQSRENGSPLTRLIFTPASNAILHDTWNTSGLRGTASDDFELHNVDVEADFTFDLIDAPIDSSKCWCIPLGVRLAMSKAASVCGIARGAMDALFPLLERKPFAGALPMREEARAQVMLAQAEATLEGGRAYLYQTVEWAWKLVQQDHQLTVNEVAKVRLAIASSAQRAVQALHLMQELAGTSAVLDPVFDRNARDLEVARHHMQLQTHIFEDVGRVLLGFSPRNPMF